MALKVLPATPGRPSDLATLRNLRITTEILSRRSHLESSESRMPTSVTSADLAERSWVAKTISGACSVSATPGLAEFLTQVFCTCQFRCECGIVVNEAGSPSHPLPVEARLPGRFGAGRVIAPGIENQRKFPPDQSAKVLWRNEVLGVTLALSSPQSRLS